MSDNNLSKQFLLARKVLGISQERVEYDTGIAQSTLSQFEHGKLNCGIKTLEKLANYYGMRLELVDGCEK